MFAPPYVCPEWFWFIFAHAAHHWEEVNHGYGAMPERLRANKSTLYTFYHRYPPRFAPNSISNPPMMVENDIEKLMVINAVVDWLTAPYNCKDFSLMDEAYMYFYLKRS